jgi:hypothetical protein
MLLSNIKDDDGMPNYEKLNMSILGMEIRKTNNNFCTHFLK